MQYSKRRNQQARHRDQLQSDKGQLRSSSLICSISRRCCQRRAQYSRDLTRV